MDITGFQIKVAEFDWEFEAIHRLNYETFVEEIPQHERNEQHRLVDKFHDENSYLICLHDKELIGMAALRANRPFSLDQKLGNVEEFLPVKYHGLAEIRLLVVKKEYRYSKVSQEFLVRVVEFCAKQYDVGVVSATLSQKRLYRHMGFTPFGPLVGKGKVQFQPMYITREVVRENFPQITDLPETSEISESNEKVLLQPGPVNINATVRQAFIEPSISHRSERFRTLLNNCKTQLCNLTSAENVEIIMGAGTLGNDIVAGQLSQLHGKGIILSNGEFGERLIDHADRFNIDFTPVRINWGEAFKPQDILQTINQESQYAWIWAVHCETSTGVINDLVMLKEICLKHDILLAMDCTSSVGTFPVDLSNVFLATTVSGKGLCSYAGLAMIFHQNKLPTQRNKLPRYLDLNNIIASHGIPFTLSSHLIRSLEQALTSERYLQRQKEIETLSHWLEKELIDRDVKIVAEKGIRNPAVLTLSLSDHLSSTQIGDALSQQGYLLSYQSEYLVRHNWLQICLFGGSYTREMFGKFLQVFDQHIQLTSNCA